MATLWMPVLMPQGIGPFLPRPLFPASKRGCAKCCEGSDCLPNVGDMFFAQAPGIQNPLQAMSQTLPRAPVLSILGPYLCRDAFAQSFGKRVARPPEDAKP